MCSMAENACLFLVGLTGIAMLVAAAWHSWRNGLADLCDRLLLYVAMTAAAVRTLALISFAFACITSPVYASTPWRLLGILVLIPVCMAVLEAIHRRQVMIRRYQLRESVPCLVQEQVAGLSHLMGVPVPKIRSSGQLQGLLAFGWTSRHACIAIPAAWSSIDALDTPERTAAVLHELAHLKNHDVALQSWADAFPIANLRILPFVLLAAFAYVVRDRMVLFGFLNEYIVVLLLLRICTTVVLRNREYLADQVAVRLVKRAQLRQAISDCLPLIHGTALAVGRSRFHTRVMHWLHDQSHSGNRAWSSVCRMVEVSVSTHPPSYERMRRLRDEGNEGPMQLSWVQSMALGLLLASLCNSVLASLTLLSTPGLLDRDLAISIGVRGVLLATALIAAPLVVVMILLPAWNRVTAPPLRLGYLLGLGGRMTASLATAVTASAVLCAISPALQILVVKWCVLVHVAAAVLTFIGMHLWALLPGLEHQRIVSFVLVFSRLFAPGCILFLVVPGALFLCSFGTGADAQLTVAMCAALGVVTMLPLLELRCAGEDGYILFSYWRRHGVVSVPEAGYGFLARWSLTFLPSTVTMLLGAILYRVAGGFAHWDVMAVVVASLGVAASTLMARENRIPYATSLRVASSLRRTLRVLQAIVPSPDLGYVAIPSPRRPSQWDMPASLWATVKTVNESSHLLVTTGHAPPDWQERATAFVGQCENQVGFGFCPGQPTRLSATFFALHTPGLDMQAIRHPADHAQWIYSLQQPDGSFRGPASRRRPYEDTYYAVSCLRTLGSDLPEPAKIKCREWARLELFERGLARNGAEAVHHCWEVLAILNATDATLTDEVAKWSRQHIHRLATANIAASAEQLLYTIQVAVHCYGMPALRRDLGNVLDSIDRRATDALVAAEAHLQKVLSK